MTFFLAQIRRTFLAGCVSLAIAVFLGISPSVFVNNAVEGEGFLRYFSAYIMLSPILFVLSSLISTIYIRHHGQFAEVHKQKPFIASFLQSIGHDLVSPFKNLGGLFTALFRKFPDVIPDDMKGAMKRKAIFRFFFMVIVILICLAGVGSFL